MSASKEMKTVENGQKKKVQWQPATMLDNVKGLDLDKFAYRWVAKDQANIAKKEAEQWTMVSTLDGDVGLNHERPGNLNDGQKLTGSGVDYRDVVLMKLPREVADARAKYYREQTDKQLSGLKKDLQSKAQAAGGSVNGQITVGTRVID